MILHLTYNIKFSSTGRSFSNSIDFQPGLTVITGSNEKGKSLILEMIEYAWFGAAALRGQASDYDLLDVTLKWETKGEQHIVSRKDAKQTLDTDKAVGAKAVNAEILKILGIDLDVFRIACSAKQGELDKLTARMRPTERRRMVDEVIGLNRVEAVEKLCRTEGNSLRRLRDNLTVKLREPIEPVEPQDYVLSSQLDILYTNQIHTEVERKHLASVVKPTLPSEPQKGEFGDDVESYESLRQAKAIERAGIERTLRTIPSIEFTRSAIDYARMYYEQDARGPQPDITEVEIDQYRKDWATLDRLSHSVQCPECNTLFVPGQGDKIEVVIEPPYTLKQLNDQAQRVLKWKDFTGTVLTDRPEMTFEEMQSQDMALGQQALRDKLLADVEAIPVMDSREDELKAKVAWDKASVTYESELQRYMDRLVDWSTAQETLAHLPEPDLDLENKLAVSRSYEEQKRFYNAELIDFVEAQAEIESLNKEIEDFNAAAESLKFVRSQIKHALVPSLNKVASHLLEEMTNGHRKTINVDEDFEVSVDGQPVRTLSGSGISVVNLSLRVALGQVLTQKVMPIFMADEVDHDMDKDRAEATHSALRTLSKTLKQVIVVSHKQVEGDHYIGV